MENPYQTTSVRKPILNEYYFFYVHPPVWNDCSIKILRVAIKELLLILEKSAQIKQKPSHIEYEAYFPPQLNLDNSKNSLEVEGPHHYDIFFWECGASRFNEYDSRGELETRHNRCK